MCFGLVAKLTAWHCRGVCETINWKELNLNMSNLSIINWHMPFSWTPGTIPGYDNAMRFLSSFSKFSGTFAAFTFLPRKEAEELGKEKVRHAAIKLKDYLFPPAASKGRDGKSLTRARGPAASSWRV